jgi:hypothetical protein
VNIVTSVSFMCHLAIVLQDICLPETNE